MSLAFNNTSSRPHGTRTEYNRSTYSAGPAETHSTYYHKATYKSAREAPAAGVSPAPSFAARDAGLFNSSPYSSRSNSVRQSPILGHSTGMDTGTGTGTGTTFREIAPSPYAAPPAPAPTPMFTGGRTPAPGLYQQQQQQQAPAFGYPGHRENIAVESSLGMAPQYPSQSAPYYPSSVQPQSQAYAPAAPSYAPAAPYAYGSSPQQLQQQQQYLSAGSPYGSRPMTALSSSGGQWSNPLHHSKVLDYPDHFLITMEVPGLTARNMRVQLLPDRILKISGECFEEHATPIENGGRRVERNHNTFSKSYTLPLSSDLANITSDVENGTLCVRIGKIAARSRGDTVPLVYGRP